MSGTGRAGAVLTAILVFILVIAASGCGTKKDAAGTAEDYIRLFASGDFTAAFAMMDESSYELQNNWTADYFAGEAEASYGGPYEVVDLVFKPQGRQGDEVGFAIQGTLKPMDGGEDMVMGGEITMKGSGEDWKVSYIDWVAVPQSSVPYDM